jgi:hypothetical protein
LGAAAGDGNHKYAAASALIRIDIENRQTGAAPFD